MKYAFWGAQYDLRKQYFDVTEWIDYLIMVKGAILVFNQRNRIVKDREVSVLKVEEQML